MSINAMSIKLKVTLMLSVLGFVSIGAGVYLFWAMSVAANDSNIIEVLGRQRMLSQAMAKGVLGTATAKDIFANVEKRVAFIDTYITKMRGTYTKSVIPTAKKSGIPISMNPAAESHPAVPFPATFLRAVNAENSKVAKDFTVDTISDNPINPDQGYKTEMDRKAGAYLVKNPDSTYYEPEKTDAGMFLNFYTPDRAVVQGCANCHTTMEGRPYKVGDLLGIRKYKIHLSKSGPLGEKMLDPSLVEYETAKNIFTKTLVAMKQGGKYPTDLALKNYATVPAIADRASQEIITVIEAKFVEMENVVGTVLKADNSESRFESVMAMLSVSNQLRKVSNDLVVQYTKVANEQQQSISIAIVVSTIVILLTIVAVFLFVARSVLGKFASLSEGMAVLSGGDTDVEVAFVEDTDEVGDMAKAVQVFKDNAIEKIRLEEEEKKASAERERVEAERAAEEKRREDEARQAEEESRARQQERDEEERSREQAEAAERAARQERVDSLTSGFGDSVASILDAVSSSAQGMEHTASSMSGVAQQTQDESATVASAAEQATANVQTVASAAEELASSVSEINRQVNQSAEIAQSAVREADETNQTINELSGSAQKVGEVVDLINDIAEQTNLLALNATIEAARAGDAGKGFAVVASEVKSLATQTAKATEEISGQIAAIQGTTDNAVKAISSIGKTINEISEITTAIASAVEEQGAATGEISRNVQEAAVGTQSVSESIVKVRGASEETGQASGQVVGAAKELAEKFGQLKGEVETFLTDIKAA
ncbi:MAG: hypothetical protein CMM08_16605 [Rhodospirillaceae bacterium]|jgi:methyl-accepting chemotaxis protein|nr:hypothetical protein [Rhodospirillaceae bacterium]